METLRTIFIVAGVLFVLLAFLFIWFHRESDELEEMKKNRDE